DEQLLKRRSAVAQARAQPNRELVDGVEAQRDARRRIGAEERVEVDAHSGREAERAAQLRSPPVLHEERSAKSLAVAAIEPRRVEQLDERLSAAEQRVGLEDRLADLGIDLRGGVFAVLHVVEHIRVA